MQNRLELIGDKIRLVALYPEEIEPYRNFESALAKKLNAVYGMDMLSAETRQGIQERLIPRIKAAGNNWLLHTIWLIISMEQQIICGAIGFKGESKEIGTLEIGAAMYEGFMNKGFMSEATLLLCDWALKRQDIAAIIASASIDNHPSQRVLQKCGFGITKTDSHSIWFEKK